MTEAITAEKNRGQLCMPMQPFGKQNVLNDGSSTRSTSTCISSCRYLWHNIDIQGYQSIPVTYDAMCFMQI